MGFKDAAPFCPASCGLALVETYRRLYGVLDPAFRLRDAESTVNVDEMSYSEFGLVPGTGLEPARLLGTGS
jgi:hypothetical protein